MKLPDVSRLEFDSKKHCYRLDGRLLSGVTSVIDGTSSKSNLIGWAANMAVDFIEQNAEVLDVIDPSGHEADKPVVVTIYKTNSEALKEARTAYAKKRDKAGQKGTDTHALVEDAINLCLKNNAGKFMPGADYGVTPFTNWALENDVQFIAAEQRLYSEAHGFAGTCDFVAIVDGKLTIGDLKTYPKMWSADAFIQMGAYSVAWTEMTGERPEQSVVVKMCDPEDERLKKYGGKAFAVYPRFALEEDEEMFLTRLRMYRYNEAFVSPKE